MNHETITQLINQAAESGKLDLCEQQLDTLPSTVLELTHLEELYLDNNQLTTLPPEIAQLTKLRVLSLTDNQLTALPSTLSALKQLQWLYLANNQFNQVPPEVTQLPELKVISLDNNHIKALPEELTQLANLKVLSLYKNPLTFPPPEIVTQGTQEILTYLRLEKQPQWAAKLLLVGEGGVGKTSLLHQLRGETFDNQQDSTHGIAVDTWALEHPTAADVTMQLRTWDFGGQTIYHATHQFFLTNRALFILVWNAVSGYEQGRLSYWLNIIQAKAPDSPILLVATHLDQRADTSFSFVEFKHKYPQIIGDQYYSVNNLTGTGVDEVCNAIAEAAAQLPLMGEKWPRRWVAAANAIRETTEKSLTPHQLHDLMAGFGLAADESVVLSKWLHELGDLLYFPANEDLKNVVILQPQWVTELMSRVLTSQQVKDKKGILTDAHRDELWGDLDHEMREHFSNLLEQFDLSYRALEDQHTRYIVECLPAEPPDYQARWDNLSDAKEIRMTYELNMLPPGIPTWFIARSHRFTTKTHWRSGALFADSLAHQHLGLIRAYREEQRLELAVRGVFPYHFFAILHDSLELTLERYPGLKMTRKRPCVGHDGQSCDYEFDYAEVEAAVQQGVTGIQCRRTFKNVSVHELMFGIDWQPQKTNEREARKDQKDNARPDKKPQQSKCPPLFTLKRHKPSWWQKPFVANIVELHLCCQASSKHPAAGGCYSIAEPKKWTKAIPFVVSLVNLASYSLSVPTSNQQVNDQLDFIKQLMQDFPDETIANHVEGQALRSFCELLKALDPLKRWGLESVHTPEGCMLWLCEEHAREYNI